jgi:glucose repression regulatory protein TUP1
LGRLLTRTSYEDEIARLRQQIEARSGGAIHPGMPLPGHPPSQQQQPPHPQQQQQSPHPQQQLPRSHQPPPPNIGPGSNYFGGIMNAHGNQGPPGLVAPPQMSEQSPNGPQVPPPPPPNHAGGYPSATAAAAVNSSNPPSSSAYMNGGAAQPPPPPPQAYGQSPSRSMPTPPTSAHPQQPQLQRQQEWGNGYNSSYRASQATSQQQQQQQQQQNESPNMKRKSAPTVPTPPQNTMSRTAPPPPPPATSNTNTNTLASPSAANAQQQQQQQQQQGLADVDPESVPANMKVEGQDWFALFNPKANRQLKVDLVHTLEHSSVVCCVKFSADGRYLAAGCNRATFIYDVATSKRVA